MWYKAESNSKIMCVTRFKISRLVIQPSTKINKGVAIMIVLACSFASGAMLIHKYTLPIVINV